MITLNHYSWAVKVYLSVLDSLKFMTPQTPDVLLCDDCGGVIYPAV